MSQCALTDQSSEPLKRLNRVLCRAYKTILAMISDRLEAPSNGAPAAGNARSRFREGCEYLDNFEYL